MERLKTILNISIIFFLCTILAGSAQAAEDLPSSFSVSPAKLEVKLEAGENLIRNIYVKNDLGRTARFKVTVEDMSGGKEPGEAEKFYGKERGPYSLKNYILIDEDELVLAPGETRSVPVMISLPDNLPPGGLYGAVFFSESSSDQKRSGPRFATRVGSLIFLRVGGNVQENGLLKQFGLIGRQNIFDGQPASFQIVYENNSNIYVNPYGYIEIRRGRAGDVLEKIPVAPWFVLPDSTRRLEVAWLDRPFLGRYHATLYLNRGYGDIVDKKEIDFWIMPIYFILWLLFGVIVVTVLSRVMLKSKKLTESKK